MTKAEMEAHWQQYSASIDRAQRALTERLFWRVLELSSESWQHIDGMLRHLQNGDGRPSSTIEGISLVLRYAPVLLDFDRLNQLEEFLSGRRRIIKAWPGDIFHDLTHARLRMMRAHALWDRIERDSSCDGSQLEREFATAHDDFSGTISTWSALQLVRCNTISGNLIVTLGGWADEYATLKCPHCGGVGALHKSAIFDETQCPRCTRYTKFVYISEGRRRSG
jgi:hypothetical protein